MAQYKSCRHYSKCDYRIGVGCCPDNCVELQPKSGQRVIYCAECSKQGDEDSCPLLSMAEYTEDDDYCSFGERKNK